MSMEPMWSDNTDLCKRTGYSYYRRLESFRNFEAEHFQSSSIVVKEAWALLPDLERTYAIKAYFACLCVACAMIEIQIGKVTKLSGTLSQLVRKLDLEDSVGWLLKIRNDLLHGNNNQKIKYELNDDEAIELDDMCRNAFVVVHRLPAWLEKSGYKM